MYAVGLNLLILHWEMFSSVITNEIDFSSFLPLFSWYQGYANLQVNLRYSSFSICWKFAYYGNYLLSNVLHQNYLRVEISCLKGFDHRICIFNVCLGFYFFLSYFDRSHFYSKLPIKSCLYLCIDIMLYNSIIILSSICHDAHFFLLL